LDSSFRTENNLKTILESLIQLHIEESPILIWQNDNGRRYSAKAKISSINIAKNAILIIPFTQEDKDVFLNLQPTSTFYIKGNVFDIAFKQEEAAVFNKDAQLIIQIPRSIKVKENRIDERFSFDDAPELVRAAVYLAGETHMSSRVIEPELHDVSVSGMCILFDKKHRHLLFDKDPIRIIRLGKLQLTQNFIGNIVYNCQHTQNRSQTKVGVRFEKRLEPTDLKKIIA
jgi:hypothetical protein